MKVLFVYSGNSDSGQNKIVENQAKSLIAKGIEIQLFPIRGNGFKGYLKNARKISELVQQIKFDLIHAHYGLSGIAAVCSKKRLIVSYMGDDLVGSNTKGGSLLLWSRILIKINSFFSKFCYDYSIVKSLEMGNNLFRGTKYSLIPNGVNLNEFFPLPKQEAREKLGIDPREKLVLFVSNPSREEKNYLLAEKAVNNLTDPLVNLHTVYNCPQDKLSTLYNAADLLLLTSFHEGSPNAIKEAMACNCPIVSTNVGDVKWVIGSVEGCFISSFDPKDVSKKIKLAIDFRKNHGQTRGRERIIELGLDSETVAQKIINVYNKILPIDD